MGYRNPVITRRFPELVEDGDSCYVIIRNPQILPAGELRALGGNVGKADMDRIRAAQQIAAAGQEVPEDLVTEEDTDRGFQMLAKLILGGRVWDPTVPVKWDDDGNLISDEETAPRLLPLPGPPEVIARLPAAILNALMEEVSKVNPPQSPADGTGTKS